MIRVGQKKILRNSIDVADTYYDIASRDEFSAKILRELGLYNQAGYFYVQAMEKFIKSCIANKIDLIKPFYADKVKSNMKHSLKSACDFLIEIFASNDDLLKEQMKKQLAEDILQGIYSMDLNNDLRYPKYVDNYNDYSFLNLSEFDCARMEDILVGLKKYLKDLSNR